MNLIKQAKTIKIMSIFSIILPLCAILVVVLWFVISFSSPNASMVAGFFVIMALVIVIAIATIVLDIICGIKILATDWKNNDLNNDKTVWGILTFVILGGIASLIFANKATKKLNEQQA